MPLELKEPPVCVAYYGLGDRERKGFFAASIWATKHDCRLGLEGDPNPNRCITRDTDLA